ncbi:MAG: signal peptidase II [Acidimicrobiales bacterium]|jgi:signal peptidase II|nr:signal peptidase II [Acidimicrobiales bacterium]
MSSVHRRLILVAAATIVIDLAVKAAAVRWLTEAIDFGVITVRATENPGMAFGVGADQPFVLVAAITGTVVAVVAVAAWHGHLGGPIGAGLVVGGGTANLANRLVGGSVVDLFDLGWWPVFNLADAALTVGIILILFGSLRHESAVPVESVHQTDDA